MYKEENRIHDLIKELNHTDEHSRLEAKKGSDAGRSILETICAFSNEPGLNGGTILLGIEDEKNVLFPSYHIVGVEDPDKLQNDLASQCAESFNQSIRPKMSVELVNDKNVLIIDVEELPEQMKPVYFKKTGLPHGAYRRIGSSDQRCTEDDLFIFYNKEDSFDSAVIEDSGLEDISEEAVDLYRKLRSKANASAEELQYEKIDLLRALNCIKKIKGEWKLTNTGLIVFGKKMALRRLLPMIRVDYIRLPGKEWVENPEERFTSSLDLRGPLIELVNRTISTIADDLPTDFLLPEGSLQAQHKWQLPYRVLREAVVNAFIHRSYRVNQPIQILRYSNRIEIINAGFSLKPEEYIGEPGSVNRNSFIAAIFHETNLAETKGTGFRTMEKLMRESEMLPPTFESNHSKNNFTLRLLFHNLLSERDIKWLSQLNMYELSENQKLALIFVREVGAIDNSTYRQLSGIKSAEASMELRDLREKELLNQKGSRKMTYYIPGKVLLPFLSTQVLPLSPQAKSLSPREPALSPQAKSLSPQAVEDELPGQIQQKLDRLGKRTKDKKQFIELILELCNFRSYSISQLAMMLKRDEKYLKKNYLNPLIKEKKLCYTIPEMISHPRQKYQTVRQEVKN
ncbi:RNA-binding domain-containing protein [Membranihabitans maritimus]|uniref:RNA-binding domain-containing protein n=1 Tax=Membranihabitans maritimus TaxID=2904244 RepID=UPI001F1F2863|nr:RNA-binding domain-containing protein [Membranihabitans maritimus]